MKVFGYLIFVLSCMTVFESIHQLEDRTLPATLSPRATMPDLYLRNAKAYLQEHSTERALANVEKAIESVEYLRKFVDPDSDRILETAIEDLKIVYGHVHTRRFGFDEVNTAFIELLNALTYVELKETEDYVKKHEVEKALHAMEYSMDHIRNALRFATGQDRVYEMLLLAQMDTIRRNHRKFTDAEIIEQIEVVLEEIDFLVTKHKLP